MKKTRSEMIDLFGLDNIRELETSSHMYNNQNHFVKTLCVSEYELRAYYDLNSVDDSKANYYEVHCLVRIVW